MPVIRTHPEHSVKASDDAIYSPGVVTPSGVVQEVGPGFVTFAPLPDGVRVTTEQVPSSEVVRITGTVEGPHGFEAALLDDGRICRLGGSIGEGRVILITASRVEVVRPDGGLHVMHTGAAFSRSPDASGTVPGIATSARAVEASASSASGAFTVMRP